MKTRKLLLSASGHFATDFYINFLPALLPVLAVKLHLSPTEVGFATMIELIVASFCQPQFGYWFDKNPRSQWAGFSLLASGVFMCLSGLAPTILYSLSLSLLQVRAMASIIHAVRWWPIRPMRKTAVL